MTTAAHNKRPSERKRLEIGLPGNQLFERFIAGSVDRDSEFRFVTSAADYIGFITGLDSTHIKITTSEALHAVLLQRSKISAIEETGRHLDDLPPGPQSQIRNFSEVFARVVARELSKE